MIFPHMSICRSPATVIVVDDDELLLDSLQSYFLRHNLASQTFDHSDQLLGYLKESYHEPLVLNDYLSSLSGEEISNQEITDHPIKFNLSDLYKKIDDKDRFFASNIIVLDEAMKGGSLNGLETAKYIREHNIPLKIIMLTAQSAAEVGLPGFKNQLIDEFISKQDSDFDEQLIAAVSRLSAQYFNERSTLVANVLSAEGASYFSSAEMLSYFEQYCKQHNICEYYFNGEGAYLCLDATGAARLLFLANDEVFDNQLAEVRDEVDSSEIIAALERREQMFGFFSPENKHTAMSEWARFLVPVKKVGASYVAEQKDMSAYGLNLDGVLSYGIWMKENA
jgi:FixJ family two-component response regulator